MKKGIHPDYHEIEVMLTDGSSFVTRSTYGKPGDKLILDIDNKSHPAWTGQARTHGKGGRADRFQRQYGGLGDI